MISIYHAMQNRERTVCDDRLLTIFFINLEESQELNNNVDFSSEFFKISDRIWKFETAMKSMNSRQGSELDL